MKVLHLLSTNKFSGAENVACQIIKLFDKDKEVSMAYCSPQGEIANTLLDKGVDFFSINKLSVKELKRVVNEFQPDIIHAHDMKASFYASFLSKKIKIVSHIHNSDFSARKFSIKSLLYRWSARKIEKIVWVSNSCLDTYYYSNKVRAKSIVLKNVIDTAEVKEKLALDENKYDFDIVYVGRLANPKNPLRLIDVIQGVCQRDNSIKVAVVGAGDLMDETILKAKEYNLDNNVTFFGFLSNPYKILSSSKIMIMTSDREGLPMVALESFSLGVPIVSTPTDGMCDLIKDGVNGYLCNTNEQFIDNIMTLLGDEKLYETLSASCIETIKTEFDKDEYKKVIFAVYQSVSSGV